MPSRKFWLYWEKNNILVGAWRSPVACLNGVQVVAGSNPVAPTNIKLPSLVVAGS
jgi:hypothetical protein